jgi:4-amino-4-deoxy-L-arabinose transferase-like glycosyltransferase
MPSLDAASELTTRPASAADDNHHLLWVTAAILALIAIRLVAAALIDLSPDETYYFDWSRFPAWSYYDHPPMVAWWIAAGTALFGDGAFGVRVVTVLSAIPTSIAVYLTGKILFDRTVAERSVLWINVTLLIAVGGFTATPDAPAVMFWALAILAFALVVRTGNGAWWLAVGLFAGLGVASKLTDLFLGLGILLCLFAMRDLRRWVKSPWTWAGGAVAVLVLVPMLLWNADHNWVTLTKQFGRVTTGTFEPLKFPEFIVTQFAVLNPLMAMFVGLGAVVWIGRKRTYPIGGIVLLLATVLPLIIYMAVHSFHEQIQGHWLAPIFPTLAVVAAAAASTPLAERWSGLRAIVFPVGVALSLIGIVIAANPGNLISYRIDAGQVIRGWDEVAAEADTMRKAAGADWIAVTHYGVASEIAYHLRGKGVPVVPIAERERYAYAPSPDPALLGKPALIISLTDFSGPCFAEIRKLGTIARKSGTETIEAFSASLGTGAKPSAFDPGCDR